MSKHEETTGEMSLIRKETATDIAEIASTASKEEAYTYKPASPSEKDDEYWATFGPDTARGKVKINRDKMLVEAYRVAKADFQRE